MQFSEEPSKDTYNTIIKMSTNENNVSICFRLKTFIINFMLIKKNLQLTSFKIKLINLSIFQIKKY